MKARALLLFPATAAAAALLAGCGSSGGSPVAFDPGAMMGSAFLPGSGPVRTIAQARRAAQRFADRLDLRVGEVMRFSNGFYVELEDGRRLATEVLVDPRTGSVRLEPGPAMMWNTEYAMAGYGWHGSTMGGGMMGGGMMGGGPDYLPDARAVSAAQAERIADRWLRARGSGLRAGEAEAFPGYYTLHVLRNGRIFGMLSVHASTGAVWYHRWHGRFLGLAE